MPARSTWTRRSGATARVPHGRRGCGSDHRTATAPADERHRRRGWWSDPEVGSDGTAEEAIAELRDERLAGPPGDAFRYSRQCQFRAGRLGRGADVGACRTASTFSSGSSTRWGCSTASPRWRSPGRTLWPTGTDSGSASRLDSGPTVRPGLLAAGYLMSSVSDLGRYLSMYLNDGRIARRGPDHLARGTAHHAVPGTGNDARAVGRRRSDAVRDGLVRRGAVGRTGAAAPRQRARLQRDDRAVAAAGLGGRSSHERH